MFSSLGLFQRLPCPQLGHCDHPNCIFSHSSETIKSHYVVAVPAEPTPHPNRVQQVVPPNIPAKRSAFSLSSTSRANLSTTSEPPKKIQRVGTLQKTRAVPSVSAQGSNGIPVLNVSPATSKIAVPVRQALLKTLYDHFVVLYDSILSTNPTLAADHALRQEVEIYEQSTKLTYRTAVIQCAAALKRRQPPDSALHDSVGTQADLAARVEARKSLASLRLTPDLLEPYTMSMEQLQTWGFFTSVPSEVGGVEPSLEGKIATCDRCAKPFRVKRMEEADECEYHWGRQMTTRINGERSRVYTCCSRLVSSSEACTRGPHVFLESELGSLHSRFPFSQLESAKQLNRPNTILDVAAVDCEMIYTTAGSRVARVSLVDGTGKKVFDEFVKMDEGVHVIDYVTRFSGITGELYAKAVLPLVSIRKALDSYIDSKTIIIGHALDNDLKTLRIIHHRCLDTAVLFPHKAGPPYRRALRDLAREHLGILIQTGGATAGHSSLEDAIATLDLVRWFVLNRGREKPSAPSATTVKG